MLPAGLVVIRKDRDMLANKVLHPFRAEVAGAAVVARGRHPDALHAEHVLLAFADGDEVCVTHLLQPEWDSPYVPQAPDPTARFSARPTLFELLPVVAQHLVQQRSHLVGVIVDRLDISFFPGHLRAAEDFPYAIFCAREVESGKFLLQRENIPTTTALAVA